MDILDLSNQFKEHEHRDDQRFEELKELIQGLDTKLTPVTDAYKVVLLSKTFITGLAAIVISISAIGAAVIWVINSAIQK